MTKRPRRWVVDVWIKLLLLGSEVLRTLERVDITVTSVPCIRIYWKSLWKWSSMCFQLIYITVWYSKYDGLGVARVNELYESKLRRAWGGTHIGMKIDLALKLNPLCCVHWATPLLIWMSFGNRPLACWSFLYTTAAAGLAYLVLFVVAATQYVSTRWSSKVTRRLEFHHTRSDFLRAHTV